MTHQTVNIVGKVNTGTKVPHYKCVKCGREWMNGKKPSNTERCFGRFGK